ncbi:hypothetical protein M427DRAFT_450437 [Gonapodya prolifera JEL478]|uniref:Uncharacterized protein n=1 Tax=Gonapodya prolifera (strain JEL478) TaxID=1344416 RepID=A0A139ARQ9_GONPJ|nr:hypothetical protein M427DRAFT_450437 [Gonapodya prolifera JEL478]|eukprot:KXS19427.1 hypothetical protein M427DRAFT_450437 [Gonapodya prolifera JEL478]
MDSGGWSNSNVRTAAAAQWNRNQPSPITQWHQNAPLPPPPPVNRHVPPPADPIAASAARMAPHTMVRGHTPRPPPIQVSPPPPPPKSQQQQPLKPMPKLLYAHPLHTLYPYILRIALLPIFGGPQAEDDSTLRLPHSLIKKLRQHCAKLYEAIAATPSNPTSPTHARLPSSNNAGAHSGRAVEPPALFHPSIGLEGLFRRVLSVVYEQTLANGKTFGGRSFDGSPNPKFADLLRYFALTTQRHLSLLPPSQIPLLFSHSPTTPLHGRPSADTALLHMCDSFVSLLRQLAASPPERGVFSPHGPAPEDADVATMLGHSEWRSYRFSLAEVLEDPREVYAGTDLARNVEEQAAGPTSPTTSPLASPVLSRPVSPLAPRAFSPLGVRSTSPQGGDDLDASGGELRRTGVDLRKADPRAAFPYWIGSVFGRPAKDVESDVTGELKAVSKESVYASLLARRDVVLRHQFPMHTREIFSSQGKLDAWTAGAVKTVDGTIKRCHAKWLDLGGVGVRTTLLTLLHPSPLTRSSL